MQRSHVILWLTGIFLLCIPMSWVVLMKDNAGATTNEKIILLSICTPLAFAMIGGICWLVYRLLKKRELAGNPTKASLFIFTGLVVGVTGITAPEAAKAIERHNKYAREDEFHEEFVRGCIESGQKTLIPMLKNEVKDPQKSLDNYCNCFYDSIYVDYEANEIMNDPDISNEEFSNHPKIREIRSKCQALMMEEVFETAASDSTDY